MNDYPRNSGNVNDFMIDMKIPDTFITEILCSMKLPKPVTAIRVECHEGYIVVSLTMQISFITKTIDLKLEIVGIQLGSEELIIVFRDLGRSSRLLTEALQLMGIKTLFGAVIRDDLIYVDLSDKWCSIISTNTLLNRVICDISVTNYSIINHHMLLKVAKISKGD